MTHPADDMLAALIVGDGDDPEAAEHLAQCARCQAVVAELAHVEMLLGDPMAHELPSPSEQLWPAIVTRMTARELEATSTSDAAPGQLVPNAPLAVVLPARGDGIPSSGPSRPASRREPRRWLASAAAAVLLIGAYAAGRLTSRPDPTPAAPVVAKATLSSLDGATRLGEAEVVTTSSGLTLRLHVDNDVPDPSSGYVEVWLINADLTRMISVGALGSGRDTQLVVPASAIEAGYRIVDLSNERYDDEPAHSGDSIMRGKLNP